MSRKQTQPSRTALRQEAMQCLFDPRAEGPMKVIADMGDPRYYEQRAIEAIHQAHICKTDDAIRDQLRQSVGLLLLSLAKRATNGQNQKTVPKGSGNPGSSGESPPT